MITTPQIISKLNTMHSSTHYPKQDKKHYQRSHGCKPQIQSPPKAKLLKTPEKPSQNNFCHKQHHGKQKRINHIKQEPKVKLSPRQKHADQRTTWEIVGKLSNKNHIAADLGTMTKPDGSHNPPTKCFLYFQVLLGGELHSNWPRPTNTNRLKVKN